MSACRDNRRCRQRQTHVPPPIPLAPGPCPPVSSEGMTTAAQGEPPPVLPLGPLLGSLPSDLFQAEVLRRLGPMGIASLAGAGRGCAAAVAATVLMQWAKRAKMTPPVRLEYHLPPLCLKQACSYAARGGNQAALEWLHNTACPWDAVTTCAAAGGGHLEVVKWLHGHGCPWHAGTCAFAAMGGHLRVLQWAREHHCPWNSYTCQYAARAGHLEVLQWALEHGCPWDNVTCIDAAIIGQLEVLQWVQEHDATGEVWSERRMRRYAAGPRKQEVLTWLDDLSAP